MIGIVDYGLGNLRAFANIYNELNTPCAIVDTAESLRSVSRIILPGVGSFDHAMESLDASGMREALDERVLKDGVPVIGICVGMQMLADSSEEGVRPGLGWVKGAVRKFDFAGSNARHRLPHMGWNTVRPKAGAKIMAGLGEASEFYFLHSYYFDCASPQSSIATAEYGAAFTCAVNAGNIYGVQFHPEKSHQNGIRLLKNFAEL